MARPVVRLFWIILLALGFTADAFTSNLVVQRVLQRGLPSAVQGRTAIIGTANYSPLKIPEEAGGRSPPPPAPAAAQPPARFIKSFPGKRAFKRALAKLRRQLTAEGGPPVGVPGVQRALSAEKALHLVLRPAPPGATRKAPTHPAAAAAYRQAPAAAAAAQQGGEAAAPRSPSRRRRRAAARPGPPPPRTAAGTAAAAPAPRPSPPPAAAATATAAAAAAATRRGAAAAGGGGGGLLLLGVERQEKRVVCYLLHDDPEKCPSGY